MKKLFIALAFLALSAGTYAQIEVVSSPADEKLPTKNGSTGTTPVGALAIPIIAMLGAYGIGTYTKRKE